MLCRIMHSAAREKDVGFRTMQGDWQVGRAAVSYRSTMLVKGVIFRQQSRAFAEPFHSADKGVTPCQALHPVDVCVEQRGYEDGLLHE